MEKSVQITGIIAIVVLIVAVLGYLAFFNTGNTINVDGSSEIEVMPDKAVIYFNVESLKSTAQEAKDANAVIVDNILIELIKEGFAREEIVTQNYNVYPEYNWDYNRQTLKGYKAVHSMKVELDSDNLGEAETVIDVVVDNGALLSYINFELSHDKEQEYKTEALKRATEDARNKAEGIAEGLGKKVGNLVSISSQSFDYYPWRLYETTGGVADAAVAKEAVTNIQPGEQTVTGRVNAVFKIR